MDIIQQLQEKYIREFTENISLVDFILNMVVVAILVYVLRLFYIRYGDAIAHRSKFAANFLPLALGTFLIITIVKSSIALSLGLVGALSIVRYRAAIKDPEELTYLLLVIGVGLAGGANQPVLVIVAFTFIMVLLLIFKRIQGKQAFVYEDQLLIHIQTDQQDVNKLTSMMTGIFDYVKLKRMDYKPDKQLLIVYSCRANDIGQIDQVKKQVEGLSATTTLSIIDQSNIAG